MKGHPAPFLARTARSVILCESQRVLRANMQAVKKIRTR
jgi:hypothetical protein